MGDDRLHRDERRNVIPAATSGKTSCGRPTRETVPAEMPKGSVFFYVGSVYHGGANRSSEQGSASTWATRSRGCGKESQYLACPPEVARTIDEDLEADRVPAEACARYFGDLQDPMEAVHGPATGVQHVSDIRDAARRTSSALHEGRGVAEPPAPRLRRGDGAYLWDDAGRQVLDGLSGLSACRSGMDVPISAPSPPSRWRRSRSRRTGES